MSPRKGTTTIQDIARALGISRNTVSKALNRHPGVPEDTRTRVLIKAQELNYKSLGDARALAPLVKQDILVICRDKQVTSSTFFVPLIQALIAEIHTAGGTPIAQFQAVDVDDTEKISPAALSAAGIIATESLSLSYIKQLAAIGKPVVFYDFYHDPDVVSQPFDLVIGDTLPLCGVIRRMYDQGARSFGFVGNLTHCYGFRERYIAFRSMMDRLPVRSGKELDLAAVNGPEDLDGVTLADAYVCANDYLAIPLLQALKSAGRKVPEEIQVCGFDGITDGAQASPPLTSVRVQAEEVAGSMVAVLFDRIAHPERKRRIVNVYTEAVYRGSVR